LIGCSSAFPHRIGADSLSGEGWETTC